MPDYKIEGGERPRETLTRELESCSLIRAEISEYVRSTAAKDLEIVPGVKCDPSPLNVAARMWGALAAIRQAFRLPEAASTATVSGCRSSVREITGNRSARTQTMATASILVLCLGFCRDTVQRNRHSQIAATVMASQTRLRIVSISSRRCESRRGWCYRPAGEGIPRTSNVAYNITYFGSKLSGLPDLHSGYCAGKRAMIAFAQRSWALSLATSREEKHNGLLQQVRQ
jgi:hypothetical protein